MKNLPTINFIGFVLRQGVNRLLPVVLFGSLVLPPVPTFAAPPPRDITYEETQRWTGKVFKKDEHVWIYTQAFADTFRMPVAAINKDLKGIEAAAFRVGEGARECGYGGKLENCGGWKQCRLDIYVDEKKHPLPWLTDKSADWLAESDSFGFLRDAERNAPGRYQPPVGIDVDRVNQVYPFGDWKAKQPALYLHNANSPEPEARADARVLAYQRRIHGDLTMIRLDYGCSGRHKRPFTSFRLAMKNGKYTVIGNGRLPQLTSFHHFQLPDAFETQIEGVLKQRQKSDEDRYKQWLNRK